MNRLFFSRRYSAVFLIMFISVCISLATRLLLMAVSWQQAHYSFTDVLGSLGIGLYYDLAISCYIALPFLLQTLGMSETLYQPKVRNWALGLGLTAWAIFAFTNLVPSEFSREVKNALSIYLFTRLVIFFVLNFYPARKRHAWRRGVLFFSLGLATFLLLFNAVSEFFFWGEFANRYNFIAVDYLVYTTEVLGNINESYPVIPIVGVLLLLTGGILYLFRNQVLRADYLQISRPQRWAFAGLLLLGSAGVYRFVGSDAQRFSNNQYASELAGNGLYSFGAAFWKNQLDFNQFYQTLPEQEAFTRLRRQLQTPHSRFTSPDVHNLERAVAYEEPEQKKNVVLISVESLSAEFMQRFGNTQNITPVLDSLGKESLFFTNLYASGTRTVRGLEALSLCIPALPGQSIVKRPDNSQLFSVGSVFRSKGYTTQYLYGGYSYFDNMKTFFGGNNYQVIDRDALQPQDVHYANVWGVADEDLFDLALHTFDHNHAAGKPFFSQVMTVSNHRPYTYPEGRIDIPPSTQSREGAVKYTDWAIGQFLRKARSKPWFANTVFVIVSDHCASAAGKTELPVTGYHIPLLIYAPGFVPAREENRMAAQIDIMPTVMGMLKLRYQSRFFGRDLFDLPPSEDRAFITTYQGLGFLRNGELLVQKPLKNIAAYKPDFASGSAASIAVNEELRKDAISWWQCADYVVRNGLYKAPSPEQNGSDVRYASQQK